MNPESLQLPGDPCHPFGKYKGRLTAALPCQYLNWFAREGFQGSRPVEWFKLT